MKIGGAMSALDLSLSLSNVSLANVIGNPSIRPSASEGKYYGQTL
jgi:hypothetical protein